MAVLIEGMEMPKNCSSCPFCFGANNICPWVMEYATCKGRHKDCPLVPVPPHGRLIDTDELFKDICNSLNEMTAIGIAVDGEWMWGKLNDALENAPTIIPASGGKEDE